MGLGIEQCHAHLRAAGWDQPLERVHRRGAIGGGSGDCRFGQSLRPVQRGVEIAGKMPGGRGDPALALLGPTSLDGGELSLGQGQSRGNREKKEGEDPTVPSRQRPERQDTQQGRDPGEG
jgi:hypothetical protein